MSPLVPLVVMVAAVGLVVFRTVTGKDSRTREALRLSRPQPRADAAPWFPCGFTVTRPGDFTASMGSAKCYVSPTEVSATAPLVGAFVFERADSTAEGPADDGSIALRSPEADLIVHPFTPSTAQALFIRQGWLRS